MGVVFLLRYIAMHYARSNAFLKYTTSAAAAKLAKPPPPKDFIDAGSEFYTFVGWDHPPPAVDSDLQRAA